MRSPPIAWSKSQGEVKNLFVDIDDALKEIIMKDQERANEIRDYYDTSDDFFYKESFQKCFKRFFIEGFGGVIEKGGKNLKLKFDIAVTFFTNEILAIELMYDGAKISVDDAITVIQSLDNKQIKGINSELIDSPLKQLGNADSLFSLRDIATAYSKYMLKKLKEYSKEFDGTKIISDRRGLPTMGHLVHVYDSKTYSSFGSIVDILESSDKYDDLLKAFYGLLYADENWRQQDINQIKKILLKNHWTPMASDFMILYQAGGIVLIERPSEMDKTPRTTPLLRKYYEIPSPYPPGLKHVGHVGLEWLSYLETILRIVDVELDLVFDEMNEVKNKLPYVLGARKKLYFIKSFINPDYIRLPIIRSFMASSFKVKYGIEDLEKNIEERFEIFRDRLGEFIDLERYITEDMTTWLGVIFSAAATTLVVIDLSQLLNIVLPSYVLILSTIAIFMAFLVIFKKIFRIILYRKLL